MTPTERAELLAKLQVLLREEQRITSDAAGLLEGVRVQAPRAWGGPPAPVRLLGRITPSCRLVAEVQVPSGRRTQTITEGYALHTIVQWLSEETP